MKNTGKKIRYIRDKNDEQKRKKYLSYSHDFAFAENVNEEREREREFLKRMAEERQGPS